MIIVESVYDIHMFYEMMCSSVRYALGRRTYIVSDTVEYVNKYIEQMPLKYLNIIKLDIEKANDLGDEIDRIEWVKLLNNINFRINKIECGGN